jgi:hypothetical protein
MRHWHCGLAAVLLLASGGCGDTLRENGPDHAFLEAPSGSETRALEGDLLPLTPGTRWPMISETSSGRRSREELVVTGPTTVPGGAPGILVEIRRNGQVWRREIYRSTAATLDLVAFGEAGHSLLVIDPPLPLYRKPARDGDQITWSGVLHFKTATYKATGYSRMTSLETVSVDAGHFTAYRIDSVLSIRRQGKPTHFPSVRWLVPNIGFVQRGYADAGEPAVARLQSIERKP